jgi:N-acetyl-anhydromuramyl-L-alanine amidase AmpD
MIIVDSLPLACTNGFRIISRKEWNANNPLDTSGVYYYKDDLKVVLKYIVIHHSGFRENIGVKNIQSYQQSCGYNDIAYHFIIDRYGKIYEGRKINTLGAHAGETAEANNMAQRFSKHIDKHLTATSLPEPYKLDPDYGAIGICLEGNFEIERPTRCQLSNLKQLVLYLMQKYNIEKDNIMLHKEVRKRLILKRNLHPIKEETHCPGKYGAAEIKHLINTI